MLTAIEVHNFKSFGQQGVRLDLAPLTILVGPNGAGKSSVLDAIGLLAQSAVPDGSGIKWQGVWADFDTDGQFAFNCGNTDLRLAFAIAFRDGEALKEWQRKSDLHPEIRSDAQTFEYRVEYAPQTREWRHEIWLDGALAAVNETKRTPQASGFRYDAALRFPLMGQHGEVPLAPLATDHNVFFPSLFTPTGYGTRDGLTVSKFQVIKEILA